MLIRNRLMIRNFLSTNFFSYFHVLYLPFFMISLNLSYYLCNFLKTIEKGKIEKAKHDFLITKRMQKAIKMHFNCGIRRYLGEI